ncbi:MAG: transcription-repair coupling factor [Marinilabiliales bacterium]|nr:MAG: transcription-repair coupling factor [Marinilabiliales bacterium]
MQQSDLISIFQKSGQLQLLESLLHEGNSKRISIQGIIGSSFALTIASIFEQSGIQQHLVVLPDKEQAAYFYNDLENLFSEQEADHNKKRVLFFPTTYKRPYEPEKLDAAYQLSRAEVLNRFHEAKRKTIVVTYPQALAEKVITKRYLAKNTMKLRKGEQVSLDFISDLLIEFEFEVVDFVAEPGQFAIRGGIVDVFSYANEHPYRIEFYGDEIESIRTFDPINQLSISNLNNIKLLPNVQDRTILEERVNFLNFIPNSTSLWLSQSELILAKVDEEYQRANEIFSSLGDKETRIIPEKLFVDAGETKTLMQKFLLLEIGTAYFKTTDTISFNQSPQPAFNNNFELLINDLSNKTSEKYSNYILSDNTKQIERIYSIFEDIQIDHPESGRAFFKALNLNLSSGFVDKDLKLCCYTDHQIFNRYNKFHLREGFGRKEALTLKELYDLQVGDFVTHIDHGVGQFDGLQIIDNNGKKQETIRLIYKNSDLLYISIHSLHRISKYVGKDGTPPVLNKLGSNAWNKLKNKTKGKVKDIARDLIKLYAKRKASKGFAFLPDTYLQNELEASFIYQDTPDQIKSTQDIKNDMEAENPMDRLVCGDVGFGKTEVAIRAAFKAVNDSKQVAVLVPTTILALQHFKTFSNRLAEFPVNIDYINRFKSSAQQKEALKKLEEGKLDIIIGTHRLLSKDVKFKDLGLFIVDEEQKFGVSAKEKLKQFKANVDTLTLTATPIPRTLQFSLMGARDLSIINTPPPNRYPVQTEVRSFGEELIKNAIEYEVSRGGQVFFVHNRVQNILDVYDMLKKFVPSVRIGVGHGQMDGKKLEKVMVDFIDGLYDVLLATTIIESGLDIANANTIIINDAQNYGLSDLHQLRGRVGRSNKKAFCYLLCPPPSTLTSEAQKRLKAISEHSELGSGFSIAMRDLDIRGAGNILGAEQSGFISEIGIEMYQKILDEALVELKETEFKDLFEEELKNKDFVKDCQFESDLGIMIPNYYVESSSERLSLYKELDSIDDEEGLEKFTISLKDRFGDLPVETHSLINTIRLRWIAKIIGFEKLIIKNNRMTGHFTGQRDSEYFASDNFGRVLEFIKAHPTLSKMKEKNDKLTLVFDGVKNVDIALRLLRMI